MSLAVLAALVVAGIIIVVVTVHRSGGSEGATIDDTGAAIVEFGKAYPALPIRDVVMTADRRAAFLRLADGRAGFIQAIGRRSITRLITTGSVEVRGTDGDRTLKLAFQDTTFKGGDYTFATTEHAAEVSLWLVETVMSGQDAASAGHRENDNGA